MAIRSILYFILLGGAVTIASGCDPRSADCFSATYAFELDVKAYPDKASIQINDSITFSVDAPTDFINKADGSSINYRDAANLGSAVNFHALAEDTSWTIKAVSYFDYILTAGKELRHGFDGGSGNEYLFVEENGRYRFELTIVPKRKGLFIVVFSNAANVYRKKDNCTKANFTINFKNTDQHYPLSPFYRPGQILVGGDYYFEVK